MKQFALLFFALFVIGGVCLCAAEPELSGILDSTVSYIAGDGSSPAHSWGVEEYANIRLRVRAGEKASFFSAFNLIAVSGSYADAAGQLAVLNQNPPFGSTPFVYGQNFAGALELERLYFRINGDYFDGEAGLLRLNFGYGQVWGSSDFLNPRNPLIPNARPRGALGMDVSFYPADSLKLMGFAAAPKDPLEGNGGGFLPGLSLDQHWDTASLQALYAYETPLPASPLGIHRFGLSLKADLELGFTADGLYTLNPDKIDGIEGLSLGAGFDYSLFGGDFYFLFEYLFNGLSSVSALDFGGSWRNRHYLYGTTLYRFNDYCNLSLSSVFCFDDPSFSPFLTLYYELFQGLSLNLLCRVPLGEGELGPAQTGARVIVNAWARLRF